MVSRYVTETIGAAYGAWAGETDLARSRSGFDAMLPPAAGDVVPDAADIGGVAGEWVEVPESGPATILYLHGGGYFIGSARGYRGLAALIARPARARAFVADYALAPESPFPGAYNDALAAYHGLIDHGVAPESLAIVGDSAGGGLAMALLVTLRDSGIPLPGCAAVMSPMVDQTLSKDTFESLAHIDPVINKEHAEKPATLYLAGTDPADVRVSPVFADLKGLPPLLIQVGSSECLLADSIRLAENARTAAVEVDLDIAYEMPHVFQMFPDRLPRAVKAITALGEFVRKHTEPRL